MGLTRGNVELVNSFTIKLGAGCCQVVARFPSRTGVPNGQVRPYESLEREENLSTRAISPVPEPVLVLPWPVENITRRGSPLHEMTRSDGGGVEGVAKFQKKGT